MTFDQENDKIEEEGSKKVTLGKKMNKMVFGLRTYGKVSFVLNFYFLYMKKNCLIVTGK